jgi:SWI/SNF-related matrix-associated actin-dependent regulator 1 of chromatin subfamily A
MSFTVTSKIKTSNIMNQNQISSSSESKFTPEQLKRMEENRLKALQLKQKASSNLPTTINSTSTNKNPETIKIHTLNTINSSSNFVPIKPFNQSNSNQPSSPSKTVSKPISSIHGKCVYLDDDSEPRFEIHVGYNKALIDLFKSIVSKKYNPNTKRWSFSLKNYDELLLKVKSALNNTVSLEPLDRVSMSSSKIAKFYLIDRNTFEVHVDYSLELQEIFKTMDTRKYDPTTKKWSFNLKDYSVLIAKIGQKFKRGEVTVSPLPKAVREVFKAQIDGKTIPRFDPSIDFEHIKTKIDKNITKSLLPFQIEGICFSVQQQGRILLADDMGLGKTIQGLAIASYYKEEWPLFVIVPSSVKFMWKESAKKWLENTLREVCEYEELDDCIQVLENGRQEIDPECKIVISSYDLLAKNVDELSQVRYKVIIADECHLLKNAKASRTKAALKLIQNCKRIILLSGTPALSR